MLLPKVFRCQGCGCDCRREPRQGRRLQKFCGQPACRRKRRALGQKEKLSSDPEYRASQKEAQIIWRQKRAGYWNQYRKAKPRVEGKNRIKQEQRDGKRRARSRLSASPANEGKEPQESVRPGRYELSPVGGTAGERWEVMVVRVLEDHGALLEKDS